MTESSAKQLAVKACSLAIRHIESRRSGIGSSFERLSRGIAVSLVLLACNGSGQKSSRATPQPVVERSCEMPQNGAGGDNNPDAGQSDAGTVTAPNVPFLSTIGCSSDFDALASLPLDVTIPGVRSMKFDIDLQDPVEKDHLYFQNSQLYPIHYDFVKANLKNPGDSSNFNVNYFGSESSRRFFLGSISHYENIDVWAMELAAYDTATADVIQKIFDVITTDKAFFRPALAFHPTSDALAQVANDLDYSIPVVTTEDIYAKTDYQPLTRATTMGVLTFLTAAEVDSGAFIPYNSIVVLDEVPNTLSVVSGVITEQFQSPLSHVNVLATNRGTPNMGLRNAKSNPTLLKYQNQWVQLTVAADKWDMVRVDPRAGSAYFDAHKPARVSLPAVDNSVTAIQDVEAIVPNYLALNSNPQTTQANLTSVITQAVAAYGGKSTNYSIMAQIPGVPVAKAFAIPTYYYDKFMRDNGIYDTIDGLLNNVDITTGEAIDFVDDPTVRARKLQDVRNAMMLGTFDQDFQDQLKAKLANDYTGLDGKTFPMRFRSSTNGEDLVHFPCSGCYNSHTGDPSDFQSILDAIRLTYSTVWLFRTFEERSYYGVDQKSVGMGLLVHHSYNTTSNGVAITTNPYDLTQSDSPAYYVNMAYGDTNKVVHLPAGVTTDQLLYYVGAPGNPVVYISYTNQPLPAGYKTVLTDQQVGQMGSGLTLINNVFRQAFTDSSGWYALEVEVEFSPTDSIGNVGPNSLWFKQVTIYPNPNASSNTSTYVTD